MKNEKPINTFISVFGDGGNLADIDLHWQCGKCSKDLYFRLVIGDGIDDVAWEAVCCKTVYTVTPHLAAYNQEPLE